MSYRRSIRPGHHSSSPPAACSLCTGQLRWLVIGSRWSGWSRSRSPSRHTRAHCCWKYQQRRFSRPRWCWQRKQRCCGECGHWGLAWIWDLEQQHSWVQATGNHQITRYIHVGNWPSRSNSGDIRDGAEFLLAEELANFAKGGGVVVDCNLPTQFGQHNPVGSHLYSNVVGVALDHLLQLIVFRAQIILVHSAGAVGVPADHEHVRLGVKGDVGQGEVLLHGSKQGVLAFCSHEYLYLHLHSTRDEDGAAILCHCEFHPDELI